MLMLRVTALDGKGTACMPPNEVRELFWNIKNHPNPRDRSESLSTLFKTILCTRTLNDQRVTDAFGASLKPFIQFVIESILQNESPENQSPAASSIFLNVFQHLMVCYTHTLQSALYASQHLDPFLQAAPVVATIAFDNEALSQLLEIKPSPQRDAIVEFLLNHRWLPQTPDRACHCSSQLCTLTPLAQLLHRPYLSIQCRCHHHLHSRRQVL